MTKSTVFTPGYERARTIAERALSVPDGIELGFRTEAHGSYEAACHAARGFQRTFSSMRAKARIPAQKRAGRDHNLTAHAVKGPYDDLACYKTVLPDEAGVIIHIVPVHMIDLEVDIIDKSTGQPLPEFSKEMQERLALFNFVDRKFAAWRTTHGKSDWFPHALDDDQERFAFAVDPDMWTEYYLSFSWNFPDWFDPIGKLVTDANGALTPLKTRPVFPRKHPREGVGSTFTLDTNTQDLNDLPMDMSMFGGVDGEDNKE